MRPTIALIGLFSLQSCLHPKQTDLQVPDRVQQIEHGTDVQIPGTTVLIDKPADYHLLQGTHLLQKDRHTFITVIEFPNVSYTGAKPGFEKKIDDGIQAGTMTKPYYRKEFLLGADSAILLYGPDTDTGGYRIMMVFGNSSSMAMVAGNYPHNDEASNQAMLKILLSARLQHSADLDSITMSKYSLDLGGTAFRYSHTEGQMSYYVAGKDTDNNYFRVAVLPGTVGTIEQRQALGHLLTNLRAKGMDIPEHKESEIVLGGNTAVEAGFPTYMNGLTVSAYVVVTGNPDVTVCLMGFAYQDELAAQMKEIAQTLRVK